MGRKQHLKYVASFYRHWDTQRQQRLLDALELDPKRKVGRLAPGDVQKLGIILAVCHHPELVLLDEPASALDPIARLRLGGNSAEGGFGVPEKRTLLQALLRKIMRMMLRWRSSRD